MDVFANLSYNCVIVGGGAAGVSAAVGAAKAGASVLLIERNPYFGGQATHCSLPSYCGFFTQADPAEQAVGGIGQIVLDNLASIGFYNGPQRALRTGTCVIPIDAEATKYAFDKCLLDSNAHYLLHTRVVDVEIADGTVKAVICSTDRGRLKVRADVFVDASGEANLVAMAGGNYRASSGEGESQVATMMFRIGGVPVSADIHPYKVQEAILKAKAAGIGPLSKDLGIIIRMPGSSGDILSILADEKTDGLTPDSLTCSEISGRQQAWAYLEAFRRFLPGFEEAYLVQTGPKIGIRDTRHIVGEYTLTKEDVLEARRFPDAIARGAWYIEAHIEQGKPSVTKPIKDLSYFGIPLGCLKVTGLTNVWAGGRIISCDPVAFASIRVMGTSFATGHAAGVAAAIQSQNGRINAENVRNELRRQGGII